VSWSYNRKNNYGIDSNFFTNFHRCGLRAGLPSELINAWKVEASGEERGKTPLKAKSWRDIRTNQWEGDN